MKRVRDLIILLLAVLFLYLIASSVVAFILQQVLEVFGLHLGFIQLLGWCLGLWFAVVLIRVIYRAYLVNKLAKRFDICMNQVRWMINHFDLFKCKNVKSWSKEKFESWMNSKIEQKKQDFHFLTLLKNWLKIMWFGKLVRKKIANSVLNWNVRIVCRSLNKNIST